MNWIIFFESFFITILCYLAFRNYYTYLQTRKATTKIAVYQRMLIDLGIYLPEFPYYDMMLRSYTEYVFDLFEFRKNSIIRPQFRALIAELEHSRYYDYYSKEIKKKTYDSNK